MSETILTIEDSNINLTYEELIYCLDKAFGTWEEKENPQITLEVEEAIYCY